MLGKYLTSEAKRIIREGNAVAHDGDVWSDAMLYSPPQARRDMSVFTQLHGLDLAVISHICKFTTNPEPIEVQLNIYRIHPTIALINLYGSS